MLRKIKKNENTQIKVKKSGLPMEGLHSTRKSRISRMGVGVK